jgi:hypothetical protein
MMIAVVTVLLFPQTPPKIRTETRVVQIDVEVRDSHGQPVAGLSRDDFTVTDAGKRRAIQIFSLEGDAGPQDGPAPDMTLPPNVFSNRSPEVWRKTLPMIEHACSGAFRRTGRRLSLPRRG